MKYFPKTRLKIHCKFECLLKPKNQELTCNLWFMGALPCFSEDYHIALYAMNCNLHENISRLCMLHWGCFCGKQFILTFNR